MMMLDTASNRTWLNRAGNQRFVGPVVAPAGEDDVIALVQRAIAAGRGVRAVGSGHSFTPIVASEYGLVDMAGVSAVLGTDRERCTAEVLAGTALRDLGPELWRAGLALKNQGDIDAQTIAGAVATGTHGSGINYGSLSSTVRGVRIVTGNGDVIDVDASSPEVLYAAQVSVGLLGVVTRLTLDVLPAYRLQEHNKILSLEDVLAAWDDYLARYRHFSFFWAPRDDSAAMYGLPQIPADHCLVKLLEELPVDADDSHPAITGTTGSRCGRSYLVYPDCSDDVSKTVELEYMVDAADGRDAFLALRRLMQTKFPEAISPIEVRWQKGEPAYLSPQHGRDSVSISVSGEQRLDYHRFLRTVHALLLDWSPRPHWGKMYYFDNARLHEVFPALDRFLEVREAFDPRGLFLNDHFHDLFATR